MRAPNVTRESDYIDIRGTARVWRYTTSRGWYVYRERSRMTQDAARQLRGHGEIVVFSADGLCAPVTFAGSSPLIDAFRRKIPPPGVSF